MKVRILKPYKVVGPEGRLLKAGEELEMSEDVAKRLASYGIVKLLEPITQEEAVKKRTKTKATKKKKR